MFRAEWKAFALFFLEIIKISRTLVALNLPDFALNNMIQVNKSAKQFHPHSHCCAEQLNNIHYRPVRHQKWNTKASNLCFCLGIIGSYNILYSVGVAFNLN